MEESPNSEIKKVLNDLEIAKEAFKNWRLVSKPYERIPEDLWSMAISLCKDYPLGKVCKELKLGWGHLKNKLESQVNFCSTKRKQSASFLELKLRDDGSYSEDFSSSCFLELKKSNGTTMKLFSNKSVPVDVFKLFSTFLKNK